MKVLWLTNTLLPSVADACNGKKTYGGGWLVGLSEAMTKVTDVSLIVCSPYNGQKMLHGNINRLEYYLFPCKDKAKYDPSIEQYLGTIINNSNPDIIHAFGTEYPTICSLMNIAPTDITIISITGLIGRCAEHYYGGILGSIRKKYYFRRLLSYIKPFNISSVEQENMHYRAIYEKRALEKAKHVIGRTTWDKACVEQINHDLQYHYCNETLRPSFYKGCWNYDKCEKYSILVGNGGYPIKGLHMMLKALPIILKHFPNTKLYIAGGNIVTNKSHIKQALLHYISTYSNYLYRMIKHLGIENSVTFTGVLNEVEMKQRYLKSNVFVLPSCIENSPNSLGEAMILGLPCVTSCVGGVQDMIRHNEEGFIYPFDEPYMLAYYVCKLFGDPVMASDIGIRAQKHAMQTHNPEKNNKILMGIYKQLLTSVSNSQNRGKTSK